MRPGHQGWRFGRFVYGRLLDTVFDRDYDSSKPPEKSNGYVFYQTDEKALESAMDRAIGLYQQAPEEYENLVIQGMEYDYSWHNPAKEYLKIYEFIRYK